MRRYASRTPGALAVGAMTGFLAIALHSAVDFSVTTPAVAIVTAIVVAQLLALNRSDPTKPPAHDHSHVDAISLGPVRSLVVGLTAFLLGGLLIVHFWQIDRVHRLKLIAFQAVHMANPPDYELAIQYLQAAERVTPDDAELRSDRGQAFLDLAPEVKVPFLHRRAPREQQSANGSTGSPGDLRGQWIWNRRRAGDVARIVSIDR